MKLDHILKNTSEALPIACQGVDCSYSSIACKRAFEEPDIHFYSTFEEVFSAVHEGRSRYGVIPIENTLAGCVTETYDLLLEYDLFIVASIAIPIEHCLLALPNASIEEVKTVFSHPQALHQCRDFLKKNPQLAPREFSNTAASAQYVACENDPTYAAIGSEACAEKYHLKILQKGIQNRKNNFTRFIVIAKDKVEGPLCERISVILRLSHHPGALYRTLSHFAQHSINLLKLESRPIPDSPFEFLFYCDFTGNMDDPQIQLIMKELPNDLIFIKYLGNYPELS